MYFFVTRFSQCWQKQVKLITDYCYFINSKTVFFNCTIIIFSMKDCSVLKLASQ